MKPKLIKKDTPKAPKPKPAPKKRARKGGPGADPREAFEALFTKGAK